ncbi:MAG: hypothetical protein ACI89L_001112 [Phycisphaerales bacterium]|jgi:hypothetical protein
MHVRLGDLLVERGAITAAQQSEILEAQLTRIRPFGVLAEEMFGVSPHVIEDTWAAQYATLATRCDPRIDAIDPAVLELIERRQAWQFGVIPVAMHAEGLELATTPGSLARAMRFCGWRLTTPSFFSICETEVLPIALEIHYPIGGLDQHFISSVMGSLARVG